MNKKISVQLSHVNKIHRDLIMLEKAMTKDISPHLPKITNLIERLEVILMLSKNVK